MRSARPISQLPIAGLPARQPLVANVSTNTEPSAQLSPVRSFLQSQLHKLTSLIHHRHLVPGHGRPPESDQSNPSWMCQSCLRTPVSDLSGL